jgi:hypothetical protein
MKVIRIPLFNRRTSFDCSSRDIARKEEPYSVFSGNDKRTPSIVNVFLPPEFAANFNFFGNGSFDCLWGRFTERFFVGTLAGSQSDPSEAACMLAASSSLSLPIAGIEKYKYKVRKKIIL